MPDPPVDYDQLLLQETKRARRRAARHSQGGTVASTTFPQQPIAGASTVTSTSAPINNVVFPSGPHLDTSSCSTASYSSLHLSYPWKMYLYHCTCNTSSQSYQTNVSHPIT
ncbi:hypothetical protein M422DRAFT_263492 [Sphaerobolus stellatus SS14]|uniref:Uncharacterized protein n=1 Tax=Sphaerobolus stellatus (strain SS14) TaxID=990650 RepID=A0A0C9UYJ7_SPHS4|nr:hypothetical protein M422DRAFT_263492 [Sphaerobolus stellatus SS14]